MGHYGYEQPDNRARLQNYRLSVLILVYLFAFVQFRHPFDLPVGLQICALSITPFQGTRNDVVLYGRKA